jgi:hypothetical protein
MLCTIILVLNEIHNDLCVIYVLGLDSCLLLVIFILNH